jgi:hypothetical protein
MDLNVFVRVLWRYRGLVFVGVTVALLLAVLSYFKITFNGASPKLQPRAAEVWQADSTILLTQHGFPAGNVNGANSVGRLIGLAPLYAKLANSDAVRAEVKGLQTELHGSYTVLPAADTSYGSVSGLPAIQILGRAGGPTQAITVTQRATDAFLRYLRQQQVGAGITPRVRVDAQLLNAPGDLALIVPRKKTLPIVVFLGVLFATIAGTFVLENARRRTTTHVVREAGTGTEAPVQDLGRSAY